MNTGVDENKMNQNNNKASSGIYDEQQFTVIKAALCALLIGVTSTAASHGGLSALDGLLEVMILASVFLLVLLVWLIISLVLVFKDEVTLQSLQKFRITMLIFVAVAVALVFLIVFEWFMVGYVVVFSLIVLALTEGVIAGVRSKRKL